MKNASPISKIGSILILVILGCLLFNLLALAGEGDGSGGGQGVPLGLESSSPADGQPGVTLQPEIKLTFNKNVINLAIREANKGCFSLAVKNGSSVPIEVIMADDQIHPEEKRNVSLKPLQALKPGTGYVVRISPQLQAKNGTRLGHEVTVNFVTAGTAPVAQEPVVIPSTPNPVEEQANHQPADSSPVDKSKESIQSPTAKEEVQTTAVKEQENKEIIKKVEPKTQTQPNNSKSNAVYNLLGGIVLLAAATYIYFKKNNKR